MKNLCILVFVLIGCSAPKEKRLVGSVEKFDPALDELIATEAQAEIIGEGFEWSEGPVWIESEKMLLFSDVPKNVIYKWTEEKGIETYLNHAGYTGTVPRGGEPGSNGLTLNNEGQLALCQHGDRRVALLTSSFKDPKPEFKTLADNYQGKKFDSPNDLVFDKQGNLFFTDPPYGLLKHDKDSSKQIPFQGVYKVKPDGAVILLIDSLTRPNGIALSPDQQTLYVANSDPSKANWYSFRIKGDSLIEGKIFASAKIAEGEKGLPDGLRVDKNGNLFATGPGGIWIFNPQGNALGRIKLPEATANCAFSTDGRTLYATSDMYLLQVTLGPK
ncbi:MAG TPA: SMP-30/gluconolactonase/LRE family protein [Cyclobacteriaceae bacterium]|nr:SMP-30/gluconolactonase/LRE family protein [Cyclobacteriaceae bacterium]